MIEIARVNLPEYLDTQDILIRRGSMLTRSDTGRWVTRLSLLATDLIASRLSTRNPGAWVTDERIAGPPDYRILIDVSELDVAANGTATLLASWQVIPPCAESHIVHHLARFTLSGSVATDRGVVRLERRLFVRLADSIEISMESFSN